MILRPTYQFFELILDTARSSKMYTSYYFRKRLREVSTEISYIGGNESLRKYQDSLYWENYNGDEQNASCLYTILFDRKLKIREIKISEKGRGIITPSIITIS